MAESKNVKVARGATVRQKKTLCACGAEMIWIRFCPEGKRGRMRQVCERALDNANLICTKVILPG